MNIEKIKVPFGIQYMSQWSEYEFPVGSHIIVDKGVTGCGYTELCLRNDKNIVLCSPRKLLLENKYEQHMKEGNDNVLYLQNPGLENQENREMYENMISQHILKCQFSGRPVKFLITYDSSKHLVEQLEKLGLLQNFIFVVDEFQSIFLDAFFKAAVEFDFVDYLQDVQSVIYLSATPMLEKYLEQTDEFKDLDYQQLDWSESGYVENIKVYRQRVKSLGEECRKIIQDYKDEKYPTIVDQSGELVESKEVVFYFNDVSDIVRNVKKMELSPDEVNIICADTQENRAKLNKLSNDLGYKDKNGPRFKIGKVPLKGEKNKKYTFCTKCTYIGADFYSSCASTFIFADPNLKCLALDISLDLPQIAGRQRDKSNPFKNSIKLYYKINRDQDNTREAFDREQENRRNETSKLLNIYEKVDSEEKISYVRKLRDGITVSKYSGDFVSISDKTGKPVYNKFIDLADERAWEVSQKDYQDSINVTRSIKETGFETESELVRSKNIVESFIRNYFMTTNLFPEKMKMYCEFSDFYSTNPLVLKILETNLDDGKYLKYYTFYGTLGCKAKEFRESYLEAGIKDNLQRDDLENLIYSSFKSGDRLTKSEIKQTLKKIYESLGISKAAKATDLEKYFKLNLTSILQPDKTKKSGFKLEDLV